MTDGAAPPPIEILLVEDDDGDLRRVLEVLRDSRVPCHVTIARDGVETLAVLRRDGAHREAPRPDLILLDTSLRRTGGLDVLSAAKADPGLARIPVVMLTSSEADQDVARAYELHASGHLIKPVSLPAFIATLRTLSIARPPEGR